MYGDRSHEYIYGGRNLVSDFSVGRQVAGSVGASGGGGKRNRMDIGSNIFVFSCFVCYDFSFGNSKSRKMQCYGIVQEERVMGIVLNEIVKTSNWG